MEPPAIEVVFWRLHVRVAKLVGRLPPSLILLMEWLALLIAGCGLGLLLFLHMRFVAIPGDGNEWSHLDTCIAPAIRDLVSDIPAGSPFVAWIDVAAAWSRLSPAEQQAFREQVQPEPWEGGRHEPWLSDPQYVFATEKGFLLLNNSLLDGSGVRTVRLRVESSGDCFGGVFTQFVLENLVGFDTVVLNSLVALHDGRGFLYSVHSRELVAIGAVSENRTSVMHRISVVVTTLFLYFVTTTLVAHTLRLTQAKVLQFTFRLQQLVRQRQPYSQLIYTHLVESLVFVPIMVGILFFLFEFFDDHLLAFMVLAMVWVCELFSVICLRTRHSIRFYPKFFRLYFVGFHMYFFRYPAGFSYLALSVTIFLQHHLILVFFCRHELPALRAGEVSTANMRQLVFATATTAPGVNNAQRTNTPAPGQIGDAARDPPTSPPPRSAPTRRSAVQVAAGQLQYQRRPQSGGLATTQALTPSERIVVARDDWSSYERARAASASGAQRLLADPQAHTAGSRRRTVGVAETAGAFRGRRSPEQAEALRHRFVPGRSSPPPRSRAAS